MRADRFLSTPVPGKEVLLALLLDQHREVPLGIPPATRGVGRRQPRHLVQCSLGLRATRVVDERRFERPREPAAARLYHQLA